MPRPYLPYRRSGYQRQDTPPPTLAEPSALSVRYLVNDIDGAEIVGSRLDNVLSAFADNKPIHPSHKQFLRDRGANALADLIDGEICEADYAERAASDRARRLQAARRREEEATMERERVAIRAAERDAAMQARLKAEEEKRQKERRRYESSPAYIAKQKTKSLLLKYGVDEFINSEDFKRLMPILRALDSGSRLDKNTVVWLKAQIHRYDLTKVLVAHHRREADAFLAEFKSSGDPWQAVNASAHLRKCGASQEASDHLGKIPPQRLKQGKLKSALLTTQGGAMRDQGRFPEAQQAGETAHALSPRDYRPCTLLGAVHIQQGNYALGHGWYQKAEERGAPPAGIDSEIRALLQSMPKEQQMSAVSELLRIDPIRYHKMNLAR